MGTPGHRQFDDGIQLRLVVGRRRVGIDDLIQEVVVEDFDEELFAGFQVDVVAVDIGCRVDLADGAHVPVEEFGAGIALEDEGSGDGVPVVDVPEGNRDSNRRRCGRAPFRSACPSEPRR